MAFIEMESGAVLCIACILLFFTWQTLRQKNKKDFSFILVVLFFFVLTQLIMNKISNSSHQSNVKKKNIEQSDGSSGLNWDKILDFIDKNEPANCGSYFKGGWDYTPLYKDIYNNKFLPHLHLWEKKTNSDRSPRVEGRTMQIISYQRLAQESFVHTVCETGFNAGHSAITWLTAKDDLHLIAFDIGSHKMTRPMAEFISNLFPGRLTIIYGDSKKTVHNWSKKNLKKCDIVSIDGGHNYPEAKADLVNFRKSAADDNILIMDDMITFPGVARALVEEREAGHVSERAVCRNKYLGHYGYYHFSIGNYIK